MSATPPPPASTGRLPPLDEAALSDEQRDVLAQVMRGRGRLPTPYRLWIHSPELARRLHPLGRYLSDDTVLSKPEAEIAVLTAARRWGADYMFVAHAREAREAGLDEAVIAAIAEGRPATPADTRQRAVADLMAALGEEGAPSRSVFDAALATLGHRAIAELLMLVGYFTAVGLGMKAYAVEPPKG